MTVGWISVYMSFPLRVFVTAAQKQKTKKRFSFILTNWFIKGAGCFHSIHYCFISASSLLSLAWSWRSWTSAQTKPTTLVSQEIHTFFPAILIEHKHTAFWYFPLLGLNHYGSCISFSFFFIFIYTIEYNYVLAFHLFNLKHPRCCFWAYVLYFYISVQTYK